MIKTKEQAIEWLQSLDDGTIVEISKKREKSIRSLAQNKYYWSVIVDII
jgi:hypothetical protein